MRIFVCSDTHGNYLDTLEALDSAGYIDLIIHLGDEVEDAEFISICQEIPVIKVAGNCDRGSYEKKERLELIHGYKIFITHGDMYGVKSGLSDLVNKALSEDADIVLFGHTHVSLIQDTEAILLLNPGSMNRQNSRMSYALLTITTESRTAEIFTFTPS